MFDDDTDMDEFVEERLANQRRYEELEDRKIKEQKEKEVKNKAA